MGNTYADLQRGFCGFRLCHEMGDFLLPRSRTGWSIHHGWRNGRFYRNHFRFNWDKGAASPFYVRFHSRAAPVPAQPAALADAVASSQCCCRIGFGMAQQPHEQQPRCQSRLRTGESSTSLLAAAKASRLPCVIELWRFSGNSSIAEPKRELCRSCSCSPSSEQQFCLSGGRLWSLSQIEGITSHQPHGVRLCLILCMKN